MSNDIGTMIKELEDYSKHLLSDDEGGISNTMLPKIVKIISDISKLISIPLHYDVLELKKIVKDEFGKPSTFYINSQIKDAEKYQNNLITDHELISESNGANKNAYFNGVCAPNRDKNRIINEIEFHLYRGNKLYFNNEMKTRTTIKHQLEATIPNIIIENIGDIQNKTMQIVSSNLENNKAQGMGTQYTYHIPGRSFMAPINNVDKE